jgi:hypothetical protein
VVADISARFRAIPSDPLSFVAESQVLPVTTSSGVRADLVFASLPNDWMKLISEREKDIDDARRRLRRYANSLDRTYLQPIVEDLSEAFARADILNVYPSCLPEAI